MKNIKLILCLLLIIMLMPFNYISADSIELDSYTDSSDFHYYVPSNISLPVSTNEINVISNETTSNNYLTDYDGNTWNLYSVTLEFYGTGDDELFKNLKSKFDNDSNISNSYNELSYQSSASYNIDGKDYTPYIDLLIAGEGKQINVKKMSGKEYEEGKQIVWSTIVQYTLNRYATNEDMMACANSTDLDEANMRKGTLQISLLYPSNTTLEEFFFSEDFNIATPSSSGDSTDTMLIIVAAVVVAIVIVFVFLYRKRKNNNRNNIYEEYNNLEINDIEPTEIKPIIQNTLDKKPVNKKVTIKKSTNKKVESKKTTNKKPVAKNLSSKKITNKKPTSKKLVNKKATSKNVVNKKPTKKTTTDKKSTSKKSVNKKLVSKKATSKKQTSKKSDN